MRSKPVPGWRRRLMCGAPASVALEFALIGPILVLFLGGAADFGFAVYCRSKLAAAVSAGAEYAVLAAAQNTSSPPSASSIAALVAQASGLGIPATTPVVSVATYCMQNTPPELIQTASNCQNGSPPNYYAVISVTYTPPLLVPINAVVGGLAITESASVELQ